jgi:dihydrodipicolinate synthase/N-acetylneuraminate lyase
MTNIANKYFVALLLPQDRSFAIDEAGIRERIRYFTSDPRFREKGALCVNPEAGEIFYMTREEKRRVLEIVIDEANGALPIIAGTFAMTTREVVDTASDAKAIGAQGIFVVPPGGAMDVTTCWDAVNYPEVWIEQIKAQDRVVDLPIVTHPVAPPMAPYGNGLPLQATLATCREIPNIVGWKMTYGYDGFRIISRALKQLERPVSVLGAVAAYFHEYRATGTFDGTASGSWNYAMEPMLDHLEAWDRGDVVEARRIWDGGLAQLHEYIFAELSRLHVRYKVAAWMRGFVSHPFMRPPMPNPRKLEVDMIRKLYQAMGIAVIDEQDVAKVRSTLPL